ncbi:hypothetical protein [Paracoccus denitrificans]|uniref:hypothetical protein n=1 Tax=Paracoccus denitrificans TaxID=266 RepID=UPI0039BF3149
MPGLFLEGGSASPRMIEQPQREGMAPFGGDVMRIVGEIADHPDAKELLGG